MAKNLVQTLVLTSKTGVKYAFSGPVNDEMGLKMEDILSVFCLPVAVLGPEYRWSEANFALARQGQQLEKQEKLPTL